MPFFSSNYNGHTAVFVEKENAAKVWNRFYGDNEVLPVILKMTLRGNLQSGYASNGPFSGYDSPVVVGNTIINFEELTEE